MFPKIIPGVFASIRNIITGDTPAEIRRFAANIDILSAKSKIREMVKEISVLSVVTSDSSYRNTLIVYYYNAVIGGHVREEVTDLNKEIAHLKKAPVTPPNAMANAARVRRILDKLYAAANYHKVPYEELMKNVKKTPYQNMLCWKIAVKLAWARWGVSLIGCSQNYYPVSAALYLHEEDFIALEKQETIMDYIESQHAAYFKEFAYELDEASAAVGANHSDDFVPMVDSVLLAAAAGPIAVYFLTMVMRVMLRYYFKSKLVVADYVQNSADQLQFYNEVQSGKGELSPEQKQKLDNSVLKLKAFKRRLLDDAKTLDDPKTAGTSLVLPPAGSTPPLKPFKPSTPLEPVGHLGGSTDMGATKLVI